MPCNLGQRKLAEHVAAGVRAAGGTPLEFNTVAVSDNLTQGTPGMRASLVSREVIADSIELVGRSQPFDGLVCLAGCDKTVPGAVMAMLRLDVPGLLLYSGAMTPGLHRGAPVTILDVWEAVGAHEGGRISDEELDALERSACPGFGACTGHFTANTMAVAVDFLGLGPIGLGSITAMDPAKAEAAEAAGRLVLDVIERDVRPSSLVTRDALENAIVGITGTGGSTNGVLHLLAIADEAGVELALEDFDRLSAATPVVTSLTPGGRYVAGDLHRAGGNAAVMRQLLGHLHGDAPTVDGRTLAEHAAARRRPGRRGAGAGRAAVQARRRPACAARQPRTRRCGREARRPRAPGASGTRAGLRLGGRVQGGRVRRLRASRGRSSCCGTRARPARPGCRRCSRSRRRSSAAGSATRSRSSRTGASAAPRAG